MHHITVLIQRTTMYKLVLWLLGFLAVIAVTLAALGAIGYSWKGLVGSLAVLCGTAWLTNSLLARVYGAVANVESAGITALLLFFLFTPAQTADSMLALAAIAVIAMASKYVIAFRGRHIFNPAACAAVIAGFCGLPYASWWVASAAMAPFVLAAGLLLLYKTQRMLMFLAFYATACSGIAALGMLDGFGLASLLYNAWASYPLLFLGAFMLTEPLTTPPTQPLRYVYAVLIGSLLASGLHVGNIFMAPELALLIGNAYAYLAQLRQRVQLRLVGKDEIAPGIYDFRFLPQRPFAYQPGQYMEVTLPVPHADLRGNRRTFTIASSPSEQEVRLGIKTVGKGSTFKRHLLQMKTGEHLYGVQLAGDFLLPSDASQKLAFIAGGIGITPFRSQLRWLADTKQSRDIVLLYVVSDPAQIIYTDVLATAQSRGVRVVFVLSKNIIPNNWEGETGGITTKLIKTAIPDYKERAFYISGSPHIVRASKQNLNNLQIKNIKTDYFFGY